MPRFTSWSSDAPTGENADFVLDAVIRPSLRQAFSLPTADSPGEEQFRQVLDALAQRSSLDRRSGLRGV